MKGVLKETDKAGMIFAAIDDRAAFIYGQTKTGEAAIADVSGFFRSIYTRTGIIPTTAHYIAEFDPPVSPRESSRAQQEEPEYESDDDCDDDDEEDDEPDDDEDDPDGDEEYEDPEDEEYDPDDEPDEGVDDELEESEDEDEGEDDEPDETTDGQQEALDAEDEAQAAIHKLLAQELELGVEKEKNEPSGPIPIPPRHKTMEEQKSLEERIIEMRDRNMATNRIAERLAIPFMRVMEIIEAEERRREEQPADEPEHKKGYRISDQTRDAVIRMYNDGGKYSEITEIFNISPSSLDRIIKRAAAEGKIAKEGKS
ncbi:MAG: helix-turn-helix domain-containing protein [Clostridiales bacterium]|nr:helix-turn-helix domain-containing protein [Clostridiales bacterium]